MRLPYRQWFQTGCLVCTLASWATSSAGAEPEPGGYEIGLGDVLQVFVWKEPDLSRDVTVRPDGNVSVPLLGEVKAAGRSPADVSRELQERLARFIAAPVVTVTLAQANSARFFVIGQVAAAGAFPLTGRVTVLQGLALAGGFREFAKTDRILILRQGSGQPTAISINYKRFEVGEELSNNIPLKPGDTIVVP
jgi:polysaccharide export outer membrane protein